MKILGMRWWIVALVFLAAVLNYVDRQVLSVLAPTIQADLGLDNRDYANILNIFLIAYTLAYLVSGKLVDRMGTRNSTLLFVVWWSLSNLATAWAQGMRSMSALRFSLGLGEAGIWPAASKIVSEWFPSRERALAIGFYTMGATIGATVAPYIVIPLAAYDYAGNLPWVNSLFGHGTGWRMAFLITGLLGVFWVIPWLLLYRKPNDSRFITQAERDLIQDGAPPANPATDEKPWSWGKVLSFKPLWLLLVGRLLTDPVWYFYQFWFAKYLNTDRGVAQSDLTITWIVYAAAGVGSLAGGWLSGVLIKRGSDPLRARLWVMLGCACITPLSTLIATVSGLPPTMVLTGVVVFASLSWLINISALIVDVAPKHSLGTIFSVVAAGSTIGGIIMNMIVAVMVSGPSTKAAGFMDAAFQKLLGPLLELVSGQGYGPWFMAMAFLHPLALLILWFGGIARSAAPSSPSPR
jgi:ACS family hexuronate transporter-like MFS transporter